MPFDGSTFSTVRAGEGGAPELGLGSGSVVGRIWRLLKHPIHRNGVRPAVPLEVASVLWEARNLIAPEKNWLRGCYHRYPGRFCAVGALRRAGRRAPQAVLTQAHWLLLEVAQDRGFQSVERMNDQSCHDVVMAAFDAAITAALD